MFYQVYHIKIFSSSFLYISNMASVIALSILYVKHPINIVISNVI